MLKNLQEDRIGGFCDGVVGNQIVGWLINHDRAHVLESVFVKSDLGGISEFKAIIYRLDVAAQVRRDEKFGFAIPISALPKFERQVSLFNRNMVLVRNGVVDLSELGPQPDPHQHCIVFLHIQKTAGTSLTVALQERFRDGEVCNYYPGHVIGLGWEALNELPERQRQAFRLLVGHMAFGIGSVLRQPVKYYTFLREPMARLKSHYWHYRAAKVNPPNNQGHAVPLHVAVNEGLTDEFDNLQVRLIAGAGSESVPLGAITSELVDLALQNIDRSFAFVGLTERMDIDAPAMFKKMGVEPVAVDRLNPTPASLVDENDEQYNLIDWGKVRENNRYDIELFETIAARAT